MTLILINSVILLLFVANCDSIPVSSGNAMFYLQKFGYVEESSNEIFGRSGSTSKVNEDTITNAIKDFQRFTGIKQTGEVNNETLELMALPRCGVKDFVGSSLLNRRKRFAFQGSRWKVTLLTYRIGKYPTRIRDTKKIDREIARAFKVWSDVTNLAFEVRRRGRVDIEVRFEEGEHGDGDPFDGPEETLAHAFFPEFGGDIHFDNEETWTMDDPAGKGTNLFQVAAHEFGHSLGLAHSDDKTALMGPLYRGYNPSFKLHEDDIRAIQAIYGKAANNDDTNPVEEDEPVGPPGKTKDAPNLCQDGSIDTITRTKNGNTYVFKGDFYWKILEDGTADGYPRRIDQDWGGLEGNLDASLTWTNGKTYFFKGSQYWRFTNRRMDRKYPKQIRVGFVGIPDNLDAAFVWSGNGKRYFFKGDQYWRYDGNRDPSVSDAYPMSTSHWVDLPSTIDAAIQWQNSKTYFFKDDKYYRYNDATNKVDTDVQYPRSTSYFWFGCL